MLDFGKKGLIGALLSATMAFGSSAYAETSMSLAWAGSEDAPYAVGANKFKELIEDYTDGEVQVNLFCCFEMGGEQEMFKKLQLGTLDGTIVAQNNVGPFFPLMDLFVLPYIFTGFDHAVAVVDGPIGKQMADQMLADTGVHLISFVDISFRNIYNSKRAIESFDDVGGLRYRVPQNVVMIDTYKAFGAEPTPIAWSETFTATQTGVVDGGDTPVFWLKAAKFYEITKHYAVTEHFALTSPLLVSDRFMQKLSPEHQEAVRRAGYEAALFERQNTLDSEAAIAEEMKAAGVMFTHPDKTPFFEAATAVKSEFAESRGEAFVELLAAIEAATP